MKYLSLCSGIEAVSCAWNGLDFEPVAFAEIEPFSCAVLHEHYPAVPNYGDITKWEDWKYEAIDNRTDLAARVLFNEKSVYGDFAPSREKIEKITRKLDEGSCCYITHARDGRYIEADNTVNTIASYIGTGGGNAPIVLSRQNTLKINCSPTIDASCSNQAHIVDCNTTLRYITPLECERLQGFTDNWTQVPWRGKSKEQCPKSLRYKAIGNSMAVPVIRWIGKQILEVCHAR